MSVAKRIIRTRLWFPGMDDRVERRVGACLECQASTKVSRRDPLKTISATRRVLAGVSS